MQQILNINFVSCNFTEFIYSNSFWMESLGLSIYSNMSSATSHSFTSSFPIWKHFIFLFLFSFHLRIYFY